MSTRAFVVAATMLLGLVGGAPAQSISDTADALETAINDLQESLDEVEGFRGSADENLAGALKSVRAARQTMRRTAITLLLESLSASRPKEYERTMAALRILEPAIFDKPKSDLVPKSK